MKIGEYVENFVLKDQNGNEFDLYKNLKQNVLLVFYPRDNTVVCSRQLSDYSLNLDEFINKGILVVGINSDSIESHKSFCSELKINFPVLSDPFKEISRRFNAINLLGLTKRKLVLIMIDRRIGFEKTVLSFRFVKTSDLLKIIT